VQGLASLTLMERPFSSFPFMPEIADSASDLFGISTKPRDSPVNLSLPFSSIGEMQ
jgi:hypothetical protein